MPTRVQAANVCGDLGRGLEYLLTPYLISRTPPPGKAQLEEVMAATALTSLSTSPSVTFSSPGEIQKSMLNYGQGPELLLFRDTEATKPLWGKQCPQT